jgi:hypothetical protein
MVHVREALAHARLAEPRAEDVRLAGGRAAADAEGGSLTERPDAARVAVKWIRDPTIWFNSTVATPFVSLREFPDERTVHSRPDVLTFSSEPRQRSGDFGDPIQL